MLLDGPMSETSNHLLCLLEFRLEGGANPRQLESSIARYLSSTGKRRHVPRSDEQATIREQVRFGIQFSFYPPSHDLELSMTARFS